MTFDLNRAARTVEVTVLGRFHGHFIFREGFGCVLQHGSARRTPKGSALLPEIAGSEVVEPTDPALKAAIDRLTAVPHTKAELVVRDGRVIAERYAADVGIYTELLAFSMTKSVIDALIGIMT
jgi:hypothetical protein